MKILLIDDEKELCEDLGRFIESIGHSVVYAYDGKEALRKVEESRFDLVLSDVTIPFINGIELTKKIKDNKLADNILLMSGMEDIISSINAIELGIVDFLTKPIDVYRLALILRIVEEKNEEARKVEIKTQTQPEKLEKKVSVKEYQFPKDFSFFHQSIGNIGIYTEKMQNLFKKLRKLQEYPNIPVLIIGETGTGKEIIAKYIHFENQAIEGPFIGINCSTLPRELFDAELFGYEKGSFTGADVKGRDGKIKLADKGTLFFDEITEIPLDLQVKLLRVIQEREYYKVGGNKPLPVNTRLVFSTNRRIKDMVKDGHFREDLFYRLSVCMIEIPPLCERKEEIVPLTILFIRQMNEEMHKNVEYIEQKALDYLMGRPWEGNVRELKNLIQKTILFTESLTLTLKDFEANLPDMKGTSNQSAVNIMEFQLPSKPFSLERLNEEIVRKALDKFNGNKTKAAEFLGLTRIQLYRRYKID